MSNFRKILTVLTLILVVFVIWSAREDIMSAIGYLANTNLFFVFLLIPEQLFMYYCAGQIFFSYMAAKGRAEISHRPGRKHKKKATAVEAINVDLATSQKDAAQKDAKKSTTSKASATTKTSSAAKSANQSVSAPAPKKFSSWLLARISFELNFVNHAIPSGGFAGLGYITWRLKEFGSSAGQTSFMYALRYAITILSNQFQTIVAIVILIATGGIVEGAWWVVGLTSLICVGIVVGLAAVVIIASSRERIDWFARIATKFINGFVNIITFGHKRQVMKVEQIQEYLGDVYKDLTVARKNKKILIHPIIWGVIYSFLEIATYWLVGISMGHVEILPQIMIAEAIASVIGAVMLTPGGVGGYEGTMIFLMSVLGVDAGLATAVVITTRVIVLIGTIVSGYGFYQDAVSKIGKKEREKIMREVGE